MKAIPIKNGIIHVGESKADCPYCTRHVGLIEVDDKLHNAKKHWITHKCKGCKRKIGITSDIMGDIRSFEL